MNSAHWSTLKSPFTNTLGLKDENHKFIDIEIIIQHGGWVKSYSEKLPALNVLPMSPGALVSYCSSMGWAPAEPCHTLKCKAGEILAGQMDLTGCVHHGKRGHNLTAGNFLKFKDLDAKKKRKGFITSLVFFYRCQSCPEGPVCGFKVALWFVLGLSFGEIRPDKVKHFHDTKRAATKIREGGKK